MFEFKNIDAYVPGRFERMGMLKGKRWYTGKLEDNKIVLVLFKPRRKEYGDKKVFSANHYGEVAGYLLALSSGTFACKAELAHLSQYYENIHKVRHGGTPEEKDGCITYSNLERGEILHHGKSVVEDYIRDVQNPEYDIVRNYENKIDICIAAIEDATRKYYKKSPKEFSDEYIEEKVAENRKAALNMIVYDCLYGNNDRHDENWAMVKNIDGTGISLYPLYDNERVLGLYENIRTIENSVEMNSVEDDSERLLFSRMRVPKEEGCNSSYREVLRYLISTYSETEELIRAHLNGNSPQVVRSYLESLSGLPKVYIEYGTAMYESRYNFAKSLVLEHRKNIKIGTKPQASKIDRLENR